MIYHKICTGPTNTLLCIKWGLDSPPKLSSCPSNFGMSGGRSPLFGKGLYSICIECPLFNGQSPPFLRYWGGFPLKIWHLDTNLWYIVCSPVCNPHSGLHKDDYCLCLDNALWHVPHSPSNHSPYGLGIWHPVGHVASCIVKTELSGTVLNPLNIECALIIIIHLCFYIH